MSPTGDLDWRPEPDGTAVRLRLRVAAGASRSRVLGCFGGALKLSVQTAPERGRANREVVALVAAALGVPSGSISLVAGETAKDKVIRVALPPADAVTRWGAFLSRQEEEARKRAVKGS